MVQDMRKIRRKKERRYLTPLLFIFNVPLWGVAIYLWGRDIDLPPLVTTDFVIEAEINVPETMELPAFHHYSSLSIEEVGLHFYSSHALLINLDTGEILFDHRGNERTYPASITKIMTVLVGLEHATSDELVVHANFDALMQANLAMAGFVYGETRTLSEVLHASMLASGADATTTLAYHVAGSYQGFVDLMNETAQALGMYNTHFTNASGLHDENQYTTAYDIALLLDYALGHLYFREIFTAPTYLFINSEGQEQLMESTMFRNMPITTFNGGEILGGKTGYTTPAGLCLASLATDGINEFALITFGATPVSLELPEHISDAFAIYEYFFNLGN